MTNKDKSETIRLKARRAAMSRLEHRPLEHISVEIRERIKSGERHL